MPPRRKPRGATAAPTAAPTKTLALEVIKGPCAGKVFNLTKTVKGTIGRTKAGNAVWIKGDQAVSQRHAEVSWNDAEKRWEITDVGSSNGTEVDGKDLLEGDAGTELVDGGVIKLGTETTVVCRVGDVEAGENEEEERTVGVGGRARGGKGSNKENESDGVNVKGDGSGGDAKPTTRTRGGKATTTTTTTSRADVYEFDEPDPASAKPSARKRARTATTTGATTNGNNTKKKSVVAVDKAETADTAPNAETEKFDIPTVEEYAKRARDDVLASIRAEATDKISELRAKAQGILDGIFSQMGVA
jgi:pSer/pThr/pTyr-binding forkhead associated (FHA) protein